MYTYIEAEYLKEYYWDKIKNQIIDSSKSQHERVKEINILTLGDGFEVACFATTTFYSPIEKVAKNLELLSPTEVLKNREKGN